MKKFLNHFRNERGVLDMSSVFTGVAIIGIMAGLVAGTFLVVVPWFEKKVVDDAFIAVEQAENSVRIDNGKFVGMTNNPSASLPDLYRDGHIKKENVQAPVCVVVNANGLSYRTYAQTASGKVFSYASASGNSIAHEGNVPCNFITP